MYLNRGLQTSLVIVTSLLLWTTIASAGCRQDDALPLLLRIERESAQNPAYSPDGRTLLFTVFHSGYNRGDAGLYTLFLDDETLALLIYEPGQSSVNLPGSSWNDAVVRITFSSDREDTDEIWTMAPDGGSLYRVTQQDPPFLHYQEPSFSADGQWIVFEAVGDAPELAQRGSLWKLRADGTDLTQLISGPVTATDNRQPNWSPVDDRIVFQRRVGDQAVWNLYTMAPDGTDIRQLTTGNSDTDASWSPDGQWIVYSSDQGALALANLFVVAAAGGTPRRVSFSTVYEDSAPSWSPDGKWIAFESHLPDDRSPASLWRIAVPEPFGACGSHGIPCDDANPCTTDDTCQFGVCLGTPDDGADCNDGNPCTREDACQSGVCSGDATPRTGCRQPFVAGRAKVTLRDAAVDRMDKLSWRWTSGTATEKAEFGDPLTSTGYAFCVYDQAAGLDQLIMASGIQPAGGWKERSTGFRYRDDGFLSDGINKVVLKAGPDRRAKILVGGKGRCLGMPVLPLSQDATVTIQFGNATTCWEARYSTSLRNEPARFKARAY